MNEFYWVPQFIWPCATSNQKKLSKLQIASKILLSCLMVAAVFPFCYMKLTVIVQEIKPNKQIKFWHVNNLQELILSYYQFYTTLFMTFKLYYQHSFSFSSSSCLYIYIYVCVCVCIYIYIYMCVCV